MSEITLDNLSKKFKKSPLPKILFRVSSYAIRKNNSFTIIKKAKFQKTKHFGTEEFISNYIEMDMNIQDIQNLEDGLYEMVITDTTTYSPNGIDYDYSTTFIKIEENT